LARRIEPEPAATHPCRAVDPERVDVDAGDVREDLGRHALRRREIVRERDWTHSPALEAAARTCSELERREARGGERILIRKTLAHRGVSIDGRGALRRSLEREGERAPGLRREPGEARILR